MIYGSENAENYTVAEGNGELMVRVFTLRQGRTTNSPAHVLRLSMVITMSHDVLLIDRVVGC